MLRTSPHFDGYKVSATSYIVKFIERCVRKFEKSLRKWGPKLSENWKICKICETKIHIKKFHEEVDSRVQSYKHDKVSKQQELKIVQAKQVTWKQDLNEEAL